MGLFLSSRLSIYQTCHIQKRQKNKSHGKEKQSGMASSASTPPLPSKIAWRQQKKKYVKRTLSSSRLSIYQTCHIRKQQKKNKSHGKEEQRGMASSARTPPLPSKIAWRQPRKIHKKDSLSSLRLSIYQTCHIRKRQKNKSHGKEEQRRMASVPLLYRVLFMYI